MKIIGIDPGLAGGFARLSVSTDQVITDLTLVEIPVLKSKKHGEDVNWPALYDQVEMMLLPADYLYVELVGAMPKQGASGGFKFGYIAGGFRMLFMRDHIPTTLVPSTVWKPALGLNTNKERSVERAGQLFPAYASAFVGPRGGIKDGIAEAALIAYYGWRHVIGDAAKVARQIKAGTMPVMQPDIKL